MEKTKRRHPSFWDEVEMPVSVPQNERAVWIDEHYPDPESHDFILSTDGSGSTDGFGAWAYVLRETGGG
jgi:hypothetical protein